MVHAVSCALAILVFCCCSIVFVSSDQGFYQNSIAMYDPTTHLNLELPFIAHNAIAINGNQFSGTNDTMYVTYIGDFSSSGPHPISDLTNPSSTISISIHLDRTIGRLQSVWIENQGYDALLLESWEIRIRENIYEIAVENIWLESFDATLAEETGDGFSPSADIKLPSSPTLLLPVKSSQLYYTDIGLNTNN